MHCNGAAHAADRHMAGRCNHHVSQLPVDPWTQHELALPACQMLQHGTPKDAESVLNGVSKRANLSKNLQVYIPGLPGAAPELFCLCLSLRPEEQVRLVAGPHQPLPSASWHALSLQSCYLTPVVNSMHSSNNSQVFVACGSRGRVVKNPVHSQLWHLEAIRDYRHAGPTQQAVYGQIMIVFVKHANRQYPLDAMGVKAELVRAHTKIAPDNHVYGINCC